MESLWANSSSPVYKLRSQTPPLSEWQFISRRDRNTISPVFISARHCLAKKKQNGCQDWASILEGELEWLTSAPTTHWRDA